MSLWMVYDIIFLLAGCYCLSLCVKVRGSGQLEDIKLLMPKKAKPEECLDAGAFLRQIWPWMAVFSVAIIHNGAAGMLEDMHLGLPHATHMVTLGLCIAAAVAFFVVQHRAIKNYWELDEDE